MQIMDWNPEFNYRIIGTWIECGPDCLMVFNLTKALPIAQIFDDEDSESMRRRRVPMCPEEWEETFGDEFYQFSLDNELYYIKPRQALQSGVKCRDAAEQTIPILSYNEIMQNAMNLKTGVVDHE